MASTLSSGIQRKFLLGSSPELHEHFKQLRDSDKYFALLATINGESLDPVRFLTPSSPSASFEENCDRLLVPELKEKEPIYAFVRRYDTAPHFISVAYVPDIAVPRRKMLFSTTHHTLVNKLGSEHFKTKVHATKPSELSGRGFQEEDAHNTLQAPLTEEEKTLGAVKRAEQEAGFGTAAKATQLSQGLSTKVDAAAVAALRGLNDGHTLVMLKVDSSSETVQLVPSSESPASIAELTSVISKTEPRFTVFRYNHTQNGSSQSPVLFFFTHPAGTVKPRERMLYPLSLSRVQNVASGEAGLTIAKTFNVDEVTEITEELVHTELYPKVEVKQAFSRPRRPQRGGRAA